MIDGEVTRSESLSRVSIEAGHTFFLLMTRADDQGCFDGRPAILMAELFPLRQDVAVSALVRWIDELEGEGLLHRYEVEGKRYVHFPTWSRYQRLRESRPKWPDPNGKCEACGKLRQPAATRGQSRPQARSEKREARSVEEQETPAPPASMSERQQPLVIPWDEIQAAFAVYGKSLRSLTDARKRLLLARVKDAGPEALVHAVHGYMAMHEGKKSNGFDPLKYLRPSTIYGATKFADYVDAYETAIARGRHPPFGASGSKRAAFDEVMRRAEERAAQEGS